MISNVEGSLTCHSDRSEATFSVISTGAEGGVEKSPLPQQP